MSRQPRSGTAARPVTIRATADERCLWSLAARLANASSLSEALRRALNAWAETVLTVQAKQSASRVQAATKQTGKAKPRHKRCQRCNQRLFVANGEIEPHMWPPVNGRASEQCL